MMKRLGALLLTLCVALPVMCGCHGSRELHSFTVPEQFDEGKQHEITFWAKNDTNKAQTDIYRKSIESFQRIYPNITVNLRLYTDYGKIYNDVITNISTNTTPNVCITYPDHIATYLTGSDVVVPLDSLIEDEKYGLGGSEVKFDSVGEEEIIPEFLRECSFDGYRYALPYMRSTEACYVNKTYVEALGYTLPETLSWDFIWEVSAAATAKDADGTFLINGQKVMIPFIYKSTDNMMIQLLRQSGGGYSDSDGSIEIFNDTTKRFLYTVSENTEKGAFSTFKISSYPANFLNAGQCIFAVDSTAGATWMGTDAPLCDISEDKIVRFETVVKPVPQLDTDNLQMISQGPSVCVFNKDDEQQVLASWLFTQYLLTNEVQIPYSQTEGYVPVTSRAQGAGEYTDYLSRCGQDNEKHYEIKIKAAELLLENIENTFVTPVFNGSASLRDAAGQMIENVTKSTRRKEEINDEYFEKLFSEMKSLYRLDRSADGDNAASGTGAELEALPKTSVILLLSVGAVWVLIILYAAVRAIIRRKNERGQPTRFK